MAMITQLSILNTKFNRDNCKNRINCKSTYYEKINSVLTFPPKNFSIISSSVGSLNVLDL